MMNLKAGMMKKIKMTQSIGLQETKLTKLILFIITWMTWMKWEKYYPFLL